MSYCNKNEFDINISSFEVENAPFVSLTCPDCGKHTAIQERAGGVIEDIFR